MITYKLRDELGSETTIEAESIQDAKTQAREWVHDVDWFQSDETFWIAVSIFDDDGDYVDRILVEIDPTEPECKRDELGIHDWQSDHSIVGGCKDTPGVFGHNGGVFINEVCVTCGMRKRIDTWAQNMSTGEQGLTSVRYDADYYADELFKENEEG